MSKRITTDDKLQVGDRIRVLGERGNSTVEHTWKVVRVHNNKEYGVKRERDGRIGKLRAMTGGYEYSISGWAGPKHVTLVKYASVTLLNR